MRIPGQHVVSLKKGTSIVKADQSDILDQAIGWHCRLADADADEHGWADFIAWLEADPMHASAYDAVAADDRVIVQARFPARPAMAGNDTERPPRGWMWLAAGTAAAVAAALIVAFLAPGLRAPASAPYLVMTGMGERRTVALGDGTTIELNGNTAIRLDRMSARVAALDRGEALFHVHHDPARPFTVTAGSMTIRDLGTEFNVASDRQGVTIAVSEGAVLFQSRHAIRKLGAGDALALRGGGREIVATKIAPDLVGGWRKGMLSFDNETVGDVASALERRYGLQLVLDYDLSHRPFTGMVHFTGVADRDVPHLAEMVGATWRRDGAQWILSGGGSASSSGVPS